LINFDNSVANSKKLVESPAKTWGIFAKQKGFFSLNFNKVRIAVT
jgi:hypothetical protein